eukprot:1340271-Rhodomonas_salina.1
MAARNRGALGRHELRVLQQSQHTLRFEASQDWLRGTEALHDAANCAVLTQRNCFPLLPGKTSAVHSGGVHVQDKRGQLRSEPRGRRAERSHRGVFPGTITPKPSALRANSRLFSAMCTGIAVDFAVYTAR